MAEEKRGGSRVFIPQEPFRKDRDSGRMVSVMNFNRARKYGEPVVICPTGPTALNTAPAVWQLKDALRDFSDNDYLICVGNPTLMCFAAVIACGNNRGRAKFLMWDRELGDYILVNFNLYQKLGEED